MESGAKHFTVRVPGCESLPVLMRMERGKRDGTKGGKA